MNPKQKLLIRADANTRIGTGHLMRCMALAQTWQVQGGAVTFITACNSSSLLNRLQSEGFDVVELPAAYPEAADWETTQSILANHPGAWVVLDGYHFEPAYQQQIKVAGHPLLMIDDLAHLSYYHADILLNQNINASQLVYRCDPHTHKLLGTQYALLRREFWSWRGWQRQTPAVAHKVLVTLGGSDPDNQTLKVIHALQRVNIDSLEAVVVVGGSNPHLDTLKATIHHSPVDIQLVQNVTNMPELMAWAHVAVSTGGSTCWELAFMGLPTLILVIADNQQEIAVGLDQVGMSVSLGWFEQVTANAVAEELSILLNSFDYRNRMNRQAVGLVDGSGANRVVRFIENFKILRTLPG